MKTLHVVIEDCPKCGKRHERNFPLPDYAKWVKKLIKWVKKICKNESVTKEFGVIFVCDNKESGGKEFKAIYTLPNTEDGRVIAKVIRTEAITNDDQVQREIGKKLLLEFTDNRREFYKYMSLISVGAIPTYIALHEFILPKNYEIPFGSIFPTCAFMVSAAIFTFFGYMPVSRSFSMDRFDEITRSFWWTTLRCKLCQWFGFLSLGYGVILGLLVLGYLYDDSHKRQQQTIEKPTIEERLEKIETQNTEILDKLDQLLKDKRGEK